MRTEIIAAAALVIGTALYFTAYGQEHLQGKVTKTEMDKAVETHYYETTNRMNYTYDTLAQTLDTTGRTKLENSQKAWKTFSKAQCIFESDYVREEEFENMMYMDCLGAMTDERGEFLNYLLYYYKDPSFAQISLKK